MISLFPSNLFAQFENAARLLQDLGSDQISVSQKASEDLTELLTSIPLEAWFQDDAISSDFAKKIGSNVDELLGKLTNHPNEKVVYCVLEVIARLGSTQTNRDEMLESMMNDLEVRPQNRQQAFRALCSITPKQEAVLSRADDIGLLFDLYNYAALLRIAGQSDGESTASKYFGLASVVEHVVFSTLRGTGHLQSEVNVLSSCLGAKNPKIVRVFCMLMLTGIGSKAIPASNAISFQLEDGDEEIRFFACVALLKIAPNDFVREVTLYRANLSKADQRYLTKALSEIKQK
jgi:hypothetical protein